MPNDAVDTSREAVERLASEYRGTMAGHVVHSWAEDAAATLRALLARAEAAEAEAYDLRLTILGGEDVPGLAGSIALDKVKDLHAENMRSLEWRADECKRQRDNAYTERDAAVAEAGRLREALREMEAANDEVCRGRSTAAYLMMIQDGQSGALIRLDAARGAARAALEGGAK